MNILRKLLIPLALVAALFAVPTSAHAVAGDPVVTVVASPAEVVAGETITFTVTIDQPGFAPTNGSQKVTYTNPSTHKTSNVANYTVIPLTYADGVWTFTYTPRASEVGRFEVFSVTVPVSAARIPRTVTGAAGFSVV